MIQRVQSLYLLTSAIICLIVFYIPIGTIGAQQEVTFSICAIKDVTDGSLIRANNEMAILLFVTIALQLVSIFLFKNRRIQAIMVQVSLILILMLAVLALLFGDIFSLSDLFGGAEVLIDYNWNIALIILSWVLTYLALRGIRKDEALVRSADRMR